MPFDLGDTVRLTAECLDAAGTLTTAASATLTIILPDGTTTALAVPAPSTVGQYVVDYTTVQAGRHGARWVFADPATAYTDMFDVRPADPPLILSLADAKRHLQITSTAHDDQVREWLETITEGVEGLAGAIVRRTVTETHDAPDVRRIVLRRTPVLTLVSVAPVLASGTAYSVGNLSLDCTTGVVQRLDGGRLRGPLTVTYAAGRAIVPASLSSAARIILQHLWRTQYGSARTPLGGGDDFAVTEPVTGFGYAIPNRALQLLEPYRLPPEAA